MSTTTSKTDTEAPPIERADYPALVEDLRGEEGYQVVAFAGRRYHWYLSGLGIRKAIKEGYAPLRLMMEIAQMGVKAAQAAASKNGKSKKFLQTLNEDELLVHYGVLFFAGTSAFYDHSLDSILARMTLSRMSEVQGVIIDEVRRMIEAGQGEKDTAEEGDAGN